MHIRNLYTIILPFIMLTVACGDPCLPTFLGDGAVVIPEGCNSPDSTTAEASDSHSGTSESATSITPGTDGECHDDEQQCGGVPLVGEMWGKCIADGTCSEGLACISDAVGQVCVPKCGECGCPSDQECGGGECLNVLNVAEACAPSCLEDIVCPVAGMFCASNFGICMWPN